LDSYEILCGIRKRSQQTTANTVSACDILSATAHDPDHSEGEDRFVTFGISLQGRLLAVSHTDRGNSIRILSARLATNAERKIYEKG